ncbi:MAG: ChaB family protein [Alphaproteobacteria bacterium]
MPYVKNTDLPDPVRKHLPAHAQTIYRESFNNAFEAFKDPAKRRGKEGAGKGALALRGGLVRVHLDLPAADLMVLPVSFQRTTILFDVDGTLIDSVADLQGAFNKLLTAAGHDPIEREDVLPLLKGHASDLVMGAFALRGETLSKTALEEKTKLFRQYYEYPEPQLTAPYAGVVETLNAMREAGLRLAVCSNKPQASAVRTLAMTGLDGYFEFVAGGDSFGGTKKPEAEHVLKTLEAVGATAEEGVLVGDTDVDIEGARNAGIPHVFCGYGYSTLAPDELGVEITIHAFDELMDVLRRLN